MRPPLWTDRLLGFPHASPDLVRRRELRHRTDSKFLLPPDGALDLLTILSEGDGYAVLPASEALIAEYRTLYFDTPALDLFLDQRRGRRVRHKVRIRHYLDRHLARLEVKTRRSEMETTKVWRERAFGVDELSPDDQAFTAERTGLTVPLVPQAWTDFQRVTLLGLATLERVTFDLGVRLGRGAAGRTLEGLVIVEVKQSPFRRSTPAMEALRRAGRRPAWASKYCSAILMTNPGMAAHDLRPGFRALLRGA